MVVVLMSCSAQQPQPEADVYFATIALVSPREVLDAVQPETRGDRAQEGLGKGLVIGTAGGAVVGALACGPFLYGLCLTAAASAGMLAGGTGGALYGFTGMPAKSAKALERNVETLSRERDLQSKLVEYIRQQVAPAMLAEPDSAEIQAVLTIENLDFVTRGNEVQLESTVKVSFESSEFRRVPQYGIRVFKGKSGEFDLKHLLDADSGELEEAVRQSLQVVAEKIVKALNDHWRTASRMHPATS